MVRLSTLAVSTLVPALKVLSTTLPESTFFRVVRTNAPPLPGLTCWNSTTAHSSPSRLSTKPFFRSFVEAMSGQHRFLVEDGEPARGGAVTRGQTCRSLPARLTRPAHTTTLNSMVNHSDDHVLRLTRFLPAPPAAVWQALTDPQALAAWFWPARHNPSADTDPRVGGAFRLTADAMAVTGTYVAVDPPHRLVFTWRWAGDDEETLVSIELSTDDGRRALYRGVRRHDG